MSGKRRRSETSWDMSQDRMPPAPWQGNRNRNRNRNRNNDDTTHNRYRDNRDESRSRSRGRDWESYDDRRNKSNNEYHYARNSSQDFSGRGDYRRDNLKESWGGGRHEDQPRRYGDDRRSSRNQYDDYDQGRQSNRSSSKPPCRFFAMGKCYRDDCRFSHDIPQDSQNYDGRSHDNNRDMTWRDDKSHGDKNDWSGKKWDGPAWDDADADQNNKTSWDFSDDKKKNTSWDDVDQNKKPTWDFDDKKKSSRDDDVSNPPDLDDRYRSRDEVNGAKSGNDDIVDEKTNSWPQMDDDNKITSKWDENGSQTNVDYLPQQHTVVDDPHLKNVNEEASKQIGVMEDNNRKSPKRNQENEKVEEGNIGNDEKSRDRDRNRSQKGSRSPYRHKSSEYGNDARNNRNSRNRYDDDDDDYHHQDGRHQSNRSSKPPCRYFAVGKCYRDDCKFSHDVPDYDHKSHDHADYNASDMSERNKSWKGPTWDDVDQNKKTTWDYSRDDKKNSSRHDDVSKSTDQMGNDRRKWDDQHIEKNDYFLPHQQNMEEANQQTFTSGNDQKGQTEKNLYNQDTRPKERSNIIGNENQNGKRQKTEPIGKVVRVANKQEQEKVEEGNIGNDEKLMRPFRSALVEFVKEVLKPKWKEGRMTREVYKTVVKKVVDKIISSIQSNQIPTTEAKIEIYLTHSKAKIIKLVEAYVEKLVKAY